MTARRFEPSQPYWRRFTWVDGAILVALAGAFYIGLHLGREAPSVLPGPEISLAPAMLPWYALRSIGRMAAAYALSMGFSLLYGGWAARSRSAERILLPLLDVLQSVPILSFLPVVLLSLAALLPLRWAVELAAVVLIFTSQAWNLTFCWYQSLRTIPKELHEAATVFRLSRSQRLRSLELPFAAIPLVWNSVMSWSGGWFFLMAAEIFTVGSRDFRLPGLGSYLHEAAQRGDGHAIWQGIATLVIVIVALDQLVWRPLLAWTERFKLEMVRSGAPTRSWVLEGLRASALVRLAKRATSRLFDVFDRGPSDPWEPHPPGPMLKLLRWGVTVVVVLVLAWGASRAMHLLAQVPGTEWVAIAGGVAATLARVTAALAVAVLWTIPVGVAIGTKPRVAAWLQPVVQVTASVPATALFPIVLAALAQRPGGLEVAAVLLMLLGTQWYVLFNVIGGAAAIPQDLRYTSDLLGLDRLQRWRTLVLPALAPFLVTGAITASGGAWNASVVAEHATFGTTVIAVRGIGALIAQATANGDYPLLLAATLAMVLAVVLINRLLWRRLYRLAEQRFRLE